VVVVVGGSVVVVTTGAVVGDAVAVVVGIAVVGVVDGIGAGSCSSELQAVMSSRTDRMRRRRIPGQGMSNFGFA